MSGYRGWCVFRFTPSSSPTEVRLLRVERRSLHDTTRGRRVSRTPPPPPRTRDGDTPLPHAFRHDSWKFGQSLLGPETLSPPFTPDRDSQTPPKLTLWSGTWGWDPGDETRKTPGRRPWRVLVFSEEIGVGCELKGVQVRVPIVPLPTLNVLPTRHGRILLSYSL